MFDGIQLNFFVQYSAFPVVSSPGRQLFGFYCRFISRKKKKKEKLCYRGMPDTSEPFYCLDLECKAFFIQQKDLLIVFVAVIGYLLFLESQSILFSLKNKRKNNHMSNRQDKFNQISLVFQHIICMHVCIYMSVYTHKQPSIYLSLTHLTEVENKTTVYFNISFILIQFASDFTFPR